jgi:energy-coupling factor transporter ATP-binding protein EcfA2
MKIPADFLTTKSRIIETVKSDIELNDMATKLFSPKTEFGIQQVHRWTEYTTTDISYLNDFQNTIKKWSPSLFRSLAAKYNNINTLYQEWTTIKDLDASTFKDKYQFIPWPHLDFLNRHKTVLQLNSFYNIISPITTLIIPILFLMIPYIMIRFMSAEPFTWTAYKTALLAQFSKHIFNKNPQRALEFIQGGRDWSSITYVAFTVGIYIFNIYRSIIDCMNFVTNTRTISVLIQRTHEYMKEVRDAAKIVANQLAISSVPFTEYRNYLNSMITKWDDCLEYVLHENRGFSLRSLTHIGNLMGDFYKLYSDYDYFSLIQDANEFVGTIDIMSGIADRYNGGHIKPFKHGKHTILKDSYYIGFMNDGNWIHEDDDTINVERYIKNTVSFKKKGMVITGANASGKTTLLKSSILCMITSQQIGMGTYSGKTTITRLYDQFYSYINIPDTSARDSLFQAEARRCKTILDSIEKDKYYMCVFDELYSGTNPIEATAAATAFIEYMVNRLPVSFILTTHYYDLCKSLEENNKLKNMNMKAIKEPNGNLQMTYKLVNGISNVHGGIMVLREQQYPEEIINAALMRL